MYTLYWTNTFIRTSRKFLNKHPDLKGIFKDILKKLQKNPNNPSLKLHRLKGKHKNKHAVSLSYSYRIVFILKIEGKKIILMDIGSHDEIY